MRDNRCVLCASAQLSPLAEAVAAELGLAFRPCAGGELALFALISRYARSASVLVIHGETPFYRLLSALFRRLNVRGRVLLVTDAAASGLENAGTRVTRLSAFPYSKADLARWVNTVLLPFMGFEPLATAWPDF